MFATFDEPGHKKGSADSAQILRTVLVLVFATGGEPGHKNGSGRRRPDPARPDPAEQTWPPARVSDGKKTEGMWWRGGATASGPNQRRRSGAVSQPSGARAT
ncbi:MAG: hypothetical protein R2746_10225 [Acidimicrobiales bacterium]